MSENNILADKISNSVENLSSSLLETYSNKGIGYIKLLAITGSTLPIILAFTDGKVGLFAMVLSFILILLAMKRIDSISTYTKSYKYMIISFITYIIFSSVYIYSLANFVSGWNFSFAALFSHYFIQTIIVVIMSLFSTYYFYKSYVEVSKATSLNIFKIAAIIMIVSMFTGIISDTLSSLLILVSTVFIIIGWTSVKTINTTEETIQDEEIIS